MHCLFRYVNFDRVRFLHFLLFSFTDRYGILSLSFVYFSLIHLIHPYIHTLIQLYMFNFTHTSGNVWYLSFRYQFARTYTHDIFHATKVHLIVFSHEMSYQNITRLNHNQILSFPEVIILRLLQHWWPLLRNFLHAT